MYRLRIAFAGPPPNRNNHTYEIIATIYYLRQRIYI